MQVCFYFFFSVPVLSNVVAIMSYMNGHVFPEDFHGPHKALMKDDLAISYHSYQISDNYATPGKNAVKKGTWHLICLIIEYLLYYTQ